MSHGEHGHANSTFDGQTIEQIPAETTSISVWEILLENFTGVNPSASDLDVKLSGFEEKITQLIETYQSNEDPSIPIASNESFYNIFTKLFIQFEELYVEEVPFNGKSLAKLADSIISKLYEFVGQRSELDFVFVTHVTMRLVIFRGNIMITDDTPERSNALDSIGKFISFASRLIRDHFDRENRTRLDFDTSRPATSNVDEVERSCYQQLVDAAELLQIVSTTTKINLTELWKSQHFSDFMVGAMLVRLVVERELKYRRGDPELFEQTANKVLSQFLVNRRLSTPLTVEDGEHIASSFKSIRRRDALRRRQSKVYFFFSEPFNRLRNDIVRNIVGSYITIYLPKALLEVETRLLIAFESLVSIDEQYVSAVARALKMATKDYTVTSVNDHLLVMMQTLYASERSVSKAVRHAFLYDYLGFIVSQLALGKSGLQVFRMFSETVFPTAEEKKELEEDEQRNSSPLIRPWLLRVLLDSVLEARPIIGGEVLALLTVEEVLTLGFQDYPGLGAGNILRFFAIFIESKSLVIVRSLFDIHNEKALVYQASQLSKLGDIVNTFAVNYEFNDGNSIADRIFRFFTAALVGISKSPLKTKQFGKAHLVLTEFLIMVLHSTQLHSIVNGLGDALPLSDYSSIPIHFRESLQSLRFTIQSFATTKVFFERMQVMEAEFAMQCSLEPVKMGRPAQRASLPRVYVVVCKAFASTILGVVKSGINDPIQRIDVLCKFVTERASIQRGQYTRDITFTPTALGLLLMKEVLESVVGFVQKNPFSLPASVGTIADLSVLLEGNQFAKSCKKSQPLIQALEGIRDDVTHNLADIVTAISEASSAVGPILEFAKDSQNPLNDEDIRSLLVHCQAKKSDLTLLASNVIATGKVWRRFSDNTLDGVHVKHVTQAMTIISSVQTLLTDLQAIDKWLHLKGFSCRLATDCILSDSLSLDTLLRWIQEIKDAWKLPPETVRDLRFFVPQACRLFDTNFSGHLERDRNRASLHHLADDERAETVSRLTRDAIQGLHNIIRDEDLPLSSLAEGDNIKGMMRVLRSGGSTHDTILRELKIVAKYFESMVSSTPQKPNKPTASRSRTPVYSAAEGVEVVRARMERLTAAVELLQLGEALPNAVKFLQDFNALNKGRADPAVQMLHHLAVRIRDHANIKLGEVTGLLREVKELTCSLGIHHLKLIGSMIECNQLFLFMQSEPDIIGQIGMLTQEMQGNPVHQGILNNLTLAHGFLLKVFPSLILKEQSPAESLQSLATSLKADRRSEETIGEIIDALKSCVRHVAEITTWFGGALGGVNADKVVANVTRFQKEGCFVARTPRCEGGAGLTLMYGNGENQFRVSDVRLQEQVRAAVFVCGDEGSANTNGLTEIQRLSLRDFIKSHELAMEIVEELAHAESVGHPYYQAQERVLGESVATADLELFLRDLKDDCSRWKEELDLAFTTVNRFTLLNRTQILQVLDAVKKKKSLTLAFQLRLCFPDLENDGANPKSFNLHVMRQFVEMMAGISETGTMEPVVSCLGEVQPTTLLSRVLSILSSMTHQLEQRGLLYLSKVDRKGTSPKVLHAVGLTDKQLISSLEQSMSCAPMSSQLLWCHKGLTAQELDRFILAAKLLSHMQFAIVGVDMLNIDMREYLLSCLTSATTLIDDEVDASVGNQLLLVFTGKNGMDAFSIFLGESAEDMSSFSPLEVFSREGVVDQFAPLVVVAGDAGAGKSTYINHQLGAANVEAQACLTVHEDFTPAAFIEQYSQYIATENQPESIGIHINITPYGNLHRLGRFLYGLFSHGLLEDEESGVVVTMMQGVRHSIYLELPALADPASVPLTAADVKRHPYVDNLSILRLLVSPHNWFVVNTNTFPMLIDDDARIACYYLDMYWQGKLAQPFKKLDKDAFLTAVSSEQISDENCSLLLDRFFSDEACAQMSNLHFHRSACVRLLAQRVRFLPCLHAKVTLNVKKLQREALTDDITVNSQLSQRYFAFLISLFIKESAALSDGSLHEDWSKIETPFTARYASSDTEGTVMYILCMSAKDEAELQTQGQGSYTAVSGAELRRNPSQLRIHFAPAFGIADTGRIVSILKPQSYVLTPDFAVKMQVLFELRKIKAPTILQGETGTGKTELLSMMALLSNADETLFPNLSHELRQVLHSLVEDKVLSHTVDSHQLLFMRDVHGSIKIRPSSRGRTRSAVGELWNSSDDPAKLLNGVAQILEDENDELLDKLAPVFLRHFRRLLRNYPLVKRTEWVTSVLYRDIRYRRRLKEHRAVDAVVGEVAVAAAPLPPVIDDGDSDVEDDDAEQAFKKNDDERSTAGAPDRGQAAGKPITSSRELSQFIRDVVTAPAKNLFHVIRMHEGIKPVEFRAAVAEISRHAINAQKISEKLELVVFIDELNTTSIMGMVKEVFMDHTLDGVPLPTNIFWVAAINPSAKVGEMKHATADVTTGTESPETHKAADFNGVRLRVQDRDYIVNPIPKSMEAAVMDYSSLSSEQEQDWMHNYLNDTNLGLATELQSTKNREIVVFALQAGIIASQKFVRDAKMDRVKVSIRDMVRAVNLYRFLMQPENREVFLPDVQGQKTREQSMIDLDRCWMALIISLGLVYYFRLEMSAASDLRSQYFAMLMSKYEFDGSAPHWDLCRRLPFDLVLTQAIDKLWDATKKPRGIAPTRGLKENIFANVVCMEACVPLIITGPPGTGKTLSFQIASRNMKGISAGSEAFKRLKLVQPFTYQCSHQSTASEIKDVFEAALARRDRFLRAGITSERCVVFMDEAGLPDTGENTGALKSVHYYTDHAVVASVMLTNHTLDAAKTNRAVQLRQSDTTEMDLIALAMGSIFDFDVSDYASVPQAVQKQIEGLCEAYRGAKEFCDIPGHPDAFHLRDFIYLCRFIRHSNETQAQSRQLLTNPKGFAKFDADTLIKALRRTFNGISDEKFKNLAVFFLDRTELFQSVVESTSAVGVDDGGGLGDRLSANVMSSLRDALQDQLRPGEDPNQSHFRHIMLIDNSTSENAISLLFDLDVLEKTSTEVFRVSDFPDDMSDLNRSMIISRIKTAVEMGKTIVLANSSSIISAFFDLVNKHYMPVGARSKIAAAAGGAVSVGGAGGGAAVIALTEDDTHVIEDRKDEQTEGSGELYYANISMGSFSRPCIVHPKTKIIVHIPLAQLPFTPLPFLNRFDKFRISVVDTLNERLKLMEKAEHDARLPSRGHQLDQSYPLSLLFRHIHEGVNHFVQEFSGKSMMYGLVEQETVAALMLRVIQDTTQSGSAVPIIRQPLHVDLLTTPHGLQWWEALIDTSDDEDHAAADPSPDALIDFANHNEASTVVKRIRVFVRALNFQLLQFARPESVFLARRRLPEAYLREYFLQEHFSAANLVRDLSTKHWNRSLSFGPGNVDDLSGNKFIIFTRTSADFYRLGRDVKVQSQLLPREDVDETSIRIIQLGSYNSADKCILDIARYIEPENDQTQHLHRRLLLVVADRAAVTTSQVNLTMREIDKKLGLYVSRESMPLVIFIQHFPSASLQLGPVFDSIPFNGWDINYCDSFQLESAVDASEFQKLSVQSLGAVESKESEPDVEEVDGARRMTITNYNDARRWMRAAFGLEAAPRPADAVKEFNEVFLNELRIALNSTIGSWEDQKKPEKLKSRGILLSFPLYANKADKVDIVMAIFDERPYILSTVLRLFTAAWASELGVTVQDAAEELIRGQSLDSLLDKTRRSFQVLLRAFCRHTLRSLCSNYGLEAIAKLPSESELQRLRGTALTSRDIAEDFILGMKCAINLIEGMKMPSAEDLRKLGGISSIVLSSDSNEPPRVPLYNELVAQVGHLQAAAVAAAIGDESVEDSLQRMTELLPKFKNLKISIECIEKSALLFEALIHDRICCKFGLDSLKPHEIPIVIAAVFAHCNDKRSVLTLMLDSKILEIATRTMASMMPMRHLLTGGVDPDYFSDSLAEVNTEDERMAGGGLGDEDVTNKGAVKLGKLFMAVNEKVVKELWNYGRRVMHGDATVDAEQWVLAIRDLSVQFESFALAQQETGHYGAVRIAIFIFICQAMSNGCTLTAIKAAFQSIFDNDFVDSDEFVTSLLSRFVSLLPRITTGLGESETLRATASLVEEFVRLLEGAQFRHATSSDVAFLLAGMGSDAEAENAAFISSVPLLVQIRWLSQMLNPQLENRGVILAMNDELARRGVVAAPFLPSNIAQTVALIRRLKRQGDDGENIAATAEAPVQDKSLAALVVHACLELYKRSAIGGNLTDLLNTATVARDRIAGGNRVNALQASALAILSVEVAAAQWREGGHSQAFVLSKSDGLLSLFAFMDGLQEYFLASLRTESAISKFLSNRDRLRQFNLPEPETWYVSREIENDADDRDDGDAVVSKDELIGRMPFMVVETDDGFGDYVALAAIVKSDDAAAPTQLRAWVDAQVAAGKLYRARMMIFLAAFHECFMQNKESRCINQFLGEAANTSQLEITGDEKEAYLRVCRGPTAGAASADDGISYLFSAASMRDKDEWMISRRNCAANAMAVILGSPPTRCYYYMVCFQRRYKDSFGLGSGFNLISKDCGYQVDLNSFKDVGSHGALGHAPFRNIRRYRALNNYLVWAAFAWGHWLRPAHEAYYDSAVTHRERFNTEAYDDESEVAQRERAYQDALTKRQRTAQNIAARAHAFLGFLETDETLVNPILFVTLCAHATATRMVSSDVPASFFPKTEEVARLQATMDFLIDACWEPTFSSTVDMLRQYEHLAKCAQIVGILMKGYKFSVIVEADFIFATRNGAEQALSRLADGPHAAGAVPDSMESAAAKYVNYFMLRVPMMAMGKHLHLLVFAYNWLHMKMAYRFTVEEALDKSAWEAVDGLEDTNDRSVGIRLLQDFEAAWNEMQNEFQTYLDCNHAQALGESEIPKIDVKLIRIGELLSQESADVVDLVNRMLDGRLVRQQNEHMSSTFLSRLLQAADADDPTLSSLNKLGCLSNKLPDQLDLRFLPREPNVMPTAALVVHSKDQQELEDFVLSHTRTVIVQGEGGVFTTHAEIDAIAVARFIITHFSGGRPCLQMQRLRTPFLRRLEDLILPPVVEDGLQSPAGSDRYAFSSFSEQVASSARRPHMMLRAAALDLDAFWKKSALSIGVEDVRERVLALLEEKMFGLESTLLNTQLKKCSAAAGSDLITTLTALVEVARGTTCLEDQVKSEDERNGEEDEDDEMPRDWLSLRISLLNASLPKSLFKAGDALATIRTIQNQIRAVALPAIAERVAEWWENQEFLFVELGSDFAVLLDADTVLQFDGLSQLAADEGRSEVEKSLVALQTAAEILNQEDFRKSVQRYGAYRLMADVLNLPGSAITDVVKTILASRQVETRHYAHLMRLIRKTCGDLELLLATMPQDRVDHVAASEGKEMPGDKDPHSYLERVPEKFEVVQELLDYSSPVTAHADATGEGGTGDDSEGFGTTVPLKRSLADQTGDWAAGRAIALDMDLGAAASIGSSAPDHDAALLLPAPAPLLAAATATTAMQSISPPQPPPAALPAAPTALLSVPAQVAAATAPPSATPHGAAEVSGCQPGARLLTKPVISASFPGTGKMLKVENFAKSSGLIEGDVRYLEEQNLVPSHTMNQLPQHMDRLRLFDSTLREIPLLLVKLTDEATSAEGVAGLLDEADELGLKILHWGGSESLTTADWNRLVAARGPSSFSLLELAACLEVRGEDMAYLAAQGVLQAAGVTLDPAAGEESLAGLRVEEAHVAGLLAALQAALADPEEVEAAQDAVDIRGDDFAEVVSGCGHSLIMHKGQQRVLKIALEMFIKTVSSTEEPAGACGTDELARRLEVRGEDMRYLAAQGVLQSAGMELGAAAGEEEEEALAGLRVEEAQVAGLLAALQAALADPEEVEAAQDAVDIRGSDFSETLLQFGHTEILFQGQLRLLSVALEAFKANMGISE